MIFCRLLVVLSFLSFEGEKREIEQNQENGGRARDVPELVSATKGLWVIQSRPFSSSVPLGKGMYIALTGGRKTSVRVLLDTL